MLSNLWKGDRDWERRGNDDEGITVPTNPESRGQSGSSWWPDAWPGRALCTNIDIMSIISIFIFNSVFENLRTKFYIYWALLCDKETPVNETPDLEVEQLALENQGKLLSTPTLCNCIIWLMLSNACYVTILPISPNWASNLVIDPHECFVPWLFTFIYHIMHASLLRW
jgi:hypothetical protein